MIKNLVYLAAFTFVVILSWIGFGVYHAYTASTITSDTSILISPIPAHFNLEIVRRIANRKVIPADLSSTSLIASTSSGIKPPPAPSIVTPAPLTLPTSSGSAQIIPSPVVTVPPTNL